jgi:hypothetical protein
MDFNPNFFRDAPAAAVWRRGLTKTLIERRKMKAYKTNSAFIDGEAKNLASFGITTDDYKAAMNQLKALAKIDTKALAYAKEVCNIIYASRLNIRANKVCADLECITEIALADTRQQLDRIAEKLENTEIAKEESEID